ncbi:MAG: histidine kinase [Lachnospiraceae bacterium]|nr:histidine kinase [Candidatus Merdinaster equi]
MKEERTLRKFIIAMASLGISLVFIWCAFYFLTIQNVRENASVQAQVQSEAILSRVEDELRSIEEISYFLAYNSRVVKLAGIVETKEFYDYGGEVSEDVLAIIRTDNPVSDIIVIGREGLCYRLKGKCSNTVLTRVKILLEKGQLNNFLVNANGVAVIGTAREITDMSEELGYVVLLLDKAKLEYIFTDYSEIDYMGIVLISGEQILCANRDIRYEDIEAIKNDSVIYKEQSIGLTGLTLLVYCDNTMSQELSGYFYIALPIMLIILVGIIAFYTFYWNKTALGPQERQLMESKMQVQEAQLENERTMTSLLKKQISSHFTVNTLTAVRSLINKGEKNEATHMCDELSWLLRYSNSPDELITLMEEFHILEQYVGIMKVRYPGKIEYSYDVEDYFEDIYIPRMILQPLIENAIAHGLSGKKKINISIKTCIEDDLYIYISDDGCGIDKNRLSEIMDKIEKEESPSEGGIKGIALANIQKRIRIACGPGYGIRIESEAGVGTTVISHLKVVRLG